MKNIKNMTIWFLLALCSISVFSCTKDFNEVNTDPIGKSIVEPHRLMAPTIVSVLTTNLIRNRNFNNELMQVTVDISDAEARVFRYDFRRTWADYNWNNWYVALTDIVDMNTIASRPEFLNTSYQGISLILQAWVYQLLTDTYGDVPYSEANRGREGIIEPAFDHQRDIYLDLLDKLEEANQLLKDDAPIVGTSDPVYWGDVSKWRRFGNSLYLRLLLRISGKSEVSTMAIAKIKEIIDTNPAEYPLMENNEHTAKVLWNGTNSTTALWSSPLMTVRPDAFRSAICDFFLDRLAAWNHPMAVRRDLGTANIPRWGTYHSPNGYVGVPSGYAPGAGMIRRSYFYSNEQNSGPSLQRDPYTGIIMQCAEVAFIKAEAVVKGWIDGSAEDFYYKGMADAINYWLPNHVSSPSDANFIQYVTLADLLWDDTLPDDDLTPGSFPPPSKMENIHVQKYYALFLTDFQQWFEYRRTGHPILPKGPGLANGGVMPARLNYPVVVQSANPTGYNNAIAVQGPDLISTEVWWQKP